MQKVILGMAALLLPTVLVAQMPKDNPYTTLYPQAEPCHWTNELPWENVYNINDYVNQGNTWDARLNAAQNAISSNGGGVIFFPSGTYNFTNDVILKDGIILRGATPPTNNALDSNYAPPTRFIFPQYVPTFTGSGTPNSTAFKSIRADFTASNIGVINIDINRAFIQFQPNYKDTTFANGYQSKWINTDKHNIIVMGVRSNNAAYPAWFWVPQSYQNAWQRFSWNTIANIDAHATRNVVIANNRLNDYTNNSVHPITDDSYAQPNFIVRQAGTTDNVTITDGNHAKFDYNAHYGITVNRFKTNFTATGLFSSVPGYWSDGNIKISYPHEEPTLFATGIEIMNNYVFKNMRVGIFAAGNGLIIKNNFILDQTGKQAFVSSTGRFTTTYNATLENRGIDFSGWNANVSNNYVQVARHQFENTQYQSIDGEGILVQECCGGTPVQDYYIKHNTLSGTNAYIGIYKTRDINNLVIDSNNLNNNHIWVYANTNNASFALNSTQITNNYNIKNIDVNGGKGGNEVIVAHNSGNGKLKVPCHVTTNNNTGFTVENCSSVTGNNYPSIELQFPKDTVIAQATNFTIPFQVTGSTLDSVELILDTKSMGKFSSTNGIIAVSSNYLTNGTHFIFAKIKDATNQEAWSAMHKIRICDTNTVTSISPNLEATTPLQIAVYPNPTVDKSTLSITTHLKGQASLRILSVLGKVMLHQNIHLQTEITELPLATQNWKSGVYIIELQQGKEKSMLKLLK